MTISRITGTYHAWRGEKAAIKERGAYEDVPGFAKSASLDDIRAHGHVLTPGRYVGAAEVEDDDVSFEERFEVFKAKLEKQFALADQLADKVREKLAGVSPNV